MAIKGFIERACQATWTKLERLFNELKNWRRVATRYDKIRESFLGFVVLASIELSIPFVYVAWLRKDKQLPCMHSSSLRQDGNLAYFAVQIRH